MKYHGVNGYGHTQNNSGIKFKARSILKINKIY